VRSVDRKASMEYMEVLIAGEPGTVERRKSG
jgi:hypothetical protein